MKETASKKTERLLDLLVLLLGARRPVPFSEIRAQFRDYDTRNPESGARAFERDKRELVLLGIPLRCVGKGTPLGDEELEEDAYDIDRERYLLPVVDFAPDELGALAVVAEVSRVQSAFPYRLEIDSALRKLAFDRESPELPSDVRLDLQTADVTRSFKRHLTLLEQAVRNRKRVQFSYRKNSGQTEARTVDPYGLVYRHGRWLLVGYCHDRKEPRTFRIDRSSRIRISPKPSQPDFDRPADLDVRALALRSPWTFALEPPVRVVIEAGPAFAIIEREDFGPAAERTRLGDGGLRIAFPCSNQAYVVARVLAAAGELRVAEPPSLRLRVKQASQTALRRYA